MSSVDAQYSFLVYPISDFRVSTGANEGDPIGLPKDVVQGDEYRLSRQAATLKLALRDGPKADQIIATGSQIGYVGDSLTIDACHTVMTPDGSLAELLLLTVWGDARPARYFLPLADMVPNRDYMLVSSETESAPQRFADIACVSFIAGTHVTLSTGAQKLVEELVEGDRVLTRDHGVQPILWVGHQTMRAMGALAPIRITQGTMSVANDLVLMPNHRLFIWQRSDEIGAGRSEVMIKASNLVNGDTVLQEEGGFFDTYNILFDRHQIIYAEGVAVESLMVTGQTRAILPEALRDVGSDAGMAASIEIDTPNLADPDDDMAQALTRASKGAPSKTRKKS